MVLSYLQTILLKGIVIIIIYIKIRMNYHYVFNLCNVTKYRPAIGREKVTLSHLVPPTTGPLMLKSKSIVA